MKTHQIFVGLLFVCISACQFNFDKETIHQRPVNKTSKEYSSAFVCPMHCKGSGSDSMGTCPVCGMNYVTKN